jgi:hypothetical protein
VNLILQPLPLKRFHSVSFVYCAAKHRSHAIAAGLIM